MPPLAVKPDMLLRGAGRLVAALARQAVTMLGSSAVAVSPPTSPCWTVATTSPAAFRPPTTKMMSPTWTATPSTFSSNSGCCATHGPCTPCALVCDFQTLRVAVVPSVPPRTTRPSETATAVAPARGSGRVSASTGVQSSNRPVVVDGQAPGRGRGSAVGAIATEQVQGVADNDGRGARARLRQGRTGGPGVEVPGAHDVGDVDVRGLVEDPSDPARTGTSAR